MTGQLARLELHRVVWSWMVGFIMPDGRMSGEGCPRNPEDFKVSVIKAWDRASIESFREFIRYYWHRLKAIESVGGDRHPNFA